MHAIDSYIRCMDHRSDNLVDNSILAHCDFLNGMQHCVRKVVRRIHLYLYHHKCIPCVGRQCNQAHNCIRNHRLHLDILHCYRMDCARMHLFPRYIQPMDFQNDPVDMCTVIDDLLHDTVH